MIVEIGMFRIDPRRAAEFEPVADDIRGAFARGGIPGLRTFHMAPTVEDVGRWAVVVGWDSVGEHEQFVASVEGQRQAGLLARFMTEQPDVFHLSLDDVEEGLR
jgi:heme-degrading monooxygenase HmoA